MTAQDTENEDRETASQLQMFYKITHSDTRWAKEQGWRVINWALLLFGALLGIQKHILPTISPIVFFFMDTFVLLVAILYLVDLHFWAVRLRRDAMAIEKKIGDVATLLERRSYDTNHRFYLGIQLAVSSVAFIFVVTIPFYLACPTL